MCLLSQMTEIQFMKMSRNEGKWYFILYQVVKEKSSKLDNLEMTGFLLFV